MSLTVSRAHLSVFPAAVRIHGLPAVALLLCGASRDLAALTVGRVLGDVPLYDTYDQAHQCRAARRVPAHQCAGREPTGAADVGR